MKLLIARKISTCEVLCVCDARCYNAHLEECTKCCCAGFNHGVGEIKARENSLTLREQMENFCKQTFGADCQIVVKAKLFQLEMFR